MRLHFQSVGTVALGLLSLSSGDIGSILSSAGGSLTPPTSKSSKSSSIPSTSSLTYSPYVTAAPTTIAAEHNDDPLVITTTFHPSDFLCTEGATELQIAKGELWQNIVTPATDITITSCLPQQFVQSLLDTSSLPPFKQLVCPFNWNRVNINSTYIVCCPV